jgi:outer membrane murein-binding lipoprotein Lpp
MVRNHDDRMDDHHGWINQLGSRMEELATAQANTEQKIAALVDAQIHTEDAMTRLATQMTELAAAQSRTEGKLDALIDVVREMRG